MNRLLEFLQDPDNKLSIKRILLVLWFLYMMVLPIWDGHIQMIHLYVFFALLGSKTIESLADIQNGH